MANVIIEMPDELAQSLEGIAAAQHKTLQELALERLRLLVDLEIARQAGSPDAVLTAVRLPPHLSASDVGELEAAIAAGRMPVRSHDLFSD